MQYFRRVMVHIVISSFIFTSIVFTKNLSAAAGLTSIDSRPIIYVVNQNPLAAYYGGQYSGYLSANLNDYQVYANYVDLKYIPTNPSQDYLIEELVSDIRRLSPYIVIVNGNLLGSALVKALPDTRILTLAYGQALNTSFSLDDPAHRLVKILSGMGYYYNAFYIFHEDSKLSISLARNLKERLIVAGVQDTVIELIPNKSIVVLESNLRDVNLKPRAVVINLLSTIKNTESGKLEYLPDIKEVFNRVNRKHLDVGFYRIPNGNECIVFEHDLSRIREYIERDSIKQPRIKPLEVKSSFNIERMDRLQLKPFYLNVIQDMDDIIK